MGKKPPECECLSASVPLPVSMTCFAPVSPQFPFPSPQTCSFSHKPLQGLCCPLSLAPAALRHAPHSRHGARSHVLRIFRSPPGIRGPRALAPRPAAAPRPATARAVQHPALSIWSLQIMRWFNTQMFQITFPNFSLLFTSSWSCS